MRPSSPQPVGLIFGRISLALILSGMLWAVWNGQTAIFVLLSLLVATAGFSGLWTRISLTRVDCERFLVQNRAFPGEHLELKLQLVNRKLLPLPWIQIDNEIPNEMARDLVVESGNRTGFGFLRCVAALLWYSKATWKYRLYCHKRGYYPLGPIRMTSGDIFGFYSRSLAKPTNDHLIVYPKIYPVDQFSIPSQHPLGDSKAEQTIFQDPTRISGLRDYTVQDSLHYIHWKASARHQNLQVKVFEPTTTLKTALFLALGSFPTHDDFCEADFEFAVSVAASIGCHLIEQKALVGLFANTSNFDSRRPTSILPSGGHRQLSAILEALAKVEPVSSASFEAFFKNEQKNLPWGTTIILICSHPLENLPELLAELKETGYKVLVVLIGAQDEDRLDDSIPYCRIDNPEKAGTIHCQISR